MRFKKYKPKNIKKQKNLILIINNNIINIFSNIKKLIRITYFNFNKMSYYTNKYPKFLKN